MAQSSTFDAPELALYGDIYRCETCSTLTDPEGVQPFADPSSSEGQTVAVSHFGKIKTALIWLVVTNPKGNRDDPNVGLGVRRFAANRTALSNADIPVIFDHFSGYDFTTASPEFFGPWRRLLDGLTVGSTQVHFDSGEICAVDLIKCPTKTGWVNFLKSAEAKKVWQNCHGLKLKGAEFVKGREFLVRQIELHSPRILFLPGTKLNGRGYTKRLLGTKDRRLEGLIDGPDNYVKAVRSLDDPRRLAVELRGARELKNVLKNKALLTSSRSTIQRIMDSWTVATVN